MVDYHKVVYRPKDKTFCAFYKDFYEHTIENHKIHSTFA